MYLNRSQTVRRGLTLIEMLVTVALLLLVMTIIVSVFRQATLSITVSKRAAVMDQSLRRLDTVLRQDLNGITAKLTPPLNPVDNLGYFTYEENSPADAQGEDTDDILAFTAKAPPGQPFTGRIWVPSSNVGNVNAQALSPVMVTSDFAEVIYFVRNGNLYRRVFLILPDRAGSLGLVQKPNENPPQVLSISNAPSDYAGYTGYGYYGISLFNASPVSWLGINDISCRPSSAFNATGVAWNVPIPNTLGDLTNRENRFASPRFRDDYVTVTVIPPSVSNGADGVADDTNFDNVPDLYPTLYPVALSLNNPGNPNGLLNVPTWNGLPQGWPTASSSYDYLPFPYVFPRAYRSTNTLYTQGPATIHVPFSGDPNNPINHNPLLVGESAGVPAPNPSIADQLVSWWGRPTWRETMATPWTDPVRRPGPPYAPFGAETTTQSAGLSWDSSGTALLPPIPDYPNNPALGSTTFQFPNNAGVWEDDLIMAGVRSFDVKAFDPYAAIYSVALPEGYYDLGYANLTAGTPTTIMQGAFNPLGYGHEGRMPPLGAPNSFGGDNRVDAQWPFSYDVNGNQLVNFIGENSASTIRLRRVFDTWSTKYTNAPALALDPTSGIPYGPPFTDGGGNMLRPVYPSYPPPYPTPLRGIEIRIRTVDPKGQQTKQLTIRQDFTDKL